MNDFTIDEVYILTFLIRSEYSWKYVFTQLPDTLVNRKRYKDSQEVKKIIHRLQSDDI